METPSQFEVPWGWEFDIILTLWRIRVGLKFYGVGNFDIIFHLWRLQARLKFHGRGNSDIILNLSKASCAILVAQFDQTVAQS